MTGPPESSPPEPSWFAVIHAAQAQALMSPPEFRVLQAFLGQENTVTQAARELHLTPLHTYRRVRHLESLGLLRLTRLQPRAGKAIRHYTSVAERFFVPHHLVPSETLEALLLEEDEFWRRLLARGMAALAADAMRSEGTYIFREPQGRVRKVTGRAQGLPVLPEHVGAQGHPAVWADWSVLCLDAGQAQHLHRELRELYDRYFNAQQSGRGTVYLLRTALAPLAAQDVQNLPFSIPQEAPERR